MSKLQFHFDWNSYDEIHKEIGETTARVSIFLDDCCLTRNEDIWSKTIRDQMHVSLYPLAMWFASSWWRLNYEVLPANARKVPTHDWRMSHEMAAANMGFVWPTIMFSADGDSIQVWAQASRGDKEESVRFLNSLDYVHYVPKEEFEKEISSLVNHVLARLDAVGCRDSDLASLWGFISDDMSNPTEHKKRRLEAELGFDPESCPDTMIEHAIALEEKIGVNSFSELTGAFGETNRDRLLAMRELVDAEGIFGNPNQILDFSIDESERKPWEVAVSAARELRQRMGNKDEPLDNSTLRELLGLPEAEIENWNPGRRTQASIAGYEQGGMKFIPRKTHPVAQRFELARFLGDYARSKNINPSSWLVSADLATARQKFQRAFAAEFLCPVNSLVDYLGDDFSETALEDAANHFAVSEKTVDSLLMNNGYLPRHVQDSGMPYVLAN